MIPSEVTDRYWLHAARAEGEYPPPTSRNGKWLVFVGRDNVDDVWSKIAQAVKKGALGSSAKVSTAKPNANAKDPSTHVICVYTYDSDDLADVKRVRQALRDLGIERPIGYKTDAATHEQRYQVRGDTRISKYWE